MVEAKRRRKSTANEAKSNVISFSSAQGKGEIHQSRAEIEDVSAASRLAAVAPDTNVISLASARMERDWKKMAYAAGSIDIDFKDVERFCGMDENGAYVLALGDRIVLGARARIQVRNLFWRYGLQQMPTTWGELRGNWKYCQLLNLWLFSLSDESPDMQRSMLARHEKRHPGHGQLLRLLMAGDLEGAHCWHRQDNRFARNATDPMLTRESEKSS
jgi:hypothetical protein